jgi:hypothetical protein
LSKKSPATKLPKSDFQIELTFRTGGLEIRSKGSISELAHEISSLSDFARLASSKLGGASGVTGLETQLLPEEPAAGIEPPVIKVSGSTTENIRSLFATPWGRAPKGVDDVAKALDVNAVPASAANIGMALISLVKKGELRRVKRGGNWVYYHIPS